MQLSVEEHHPRKCAHSIIHPFKEPSHTIYDVNAFLYHQQAHAHELTEGGDTVKELCIIFARALLVKLQFARHDYKVLRVEDATMFLDESVSTARLLLLCNEPQCSIGRHDDVLLIDDAHLALDIKSVKATHGREDEASVEAFCQEKHVLDDHCSACDRFGRHALVAIDWLEHRVSEACDE